MQLDGLEVVDEHEKANELSDQAMQNLDNAAMEDALDLRPYDWTIHDKNGVLLGTQGQSADAQEAFFEADTLLMEGLGPEDDCREARIAQLDQRLGEYSLPDTAATECDRGNQCRSPGIRTADRDGVGCNLWYQFHAGVLPLS